MKPVNMDRDIIRRLKAEIDNELSFLDEIQHEMAKVAPKLARNTPSILDLRAAGSILHDFYNGVENMFRRIAQEVNGGLPTGDDWHKQLLRDMSLEIDGLRPAIISKSLVGELQRYLGFRHVFRNIYGFSLEAKRIKELVCDFPNVLSRFKREIGKFQHYLARILK